jgi:hypothetical protein
MWVAAAIGGAGLLSAGASIFGASTQANAATQASQLQQQTQQQALQQQLGLFNTAKGTLQPFIDSGSSALPTLSKLLTPGADMSSVLAQIPGFQFSQQYGQKAITNQATSRGLSGNALTAGADYATGSANSAYSGIVQALLGQANLGAGAAGSVAGAAGATGGQVGQTMTNLGNAQASGVLGSANALSSGATGVANAASGGVNSFTNLSLLKSLLNNGQYGNAVNAGTQPGVSNGGFNYIDSAAA